MSFDELLVSEQQYDHPLVLYMLVLLEIIFFAFYVIASQNNRYDSLRSIIIVHDYPEGLEFSDNLVLHQNYGSIELV